MSRQFIVRAAKWLWLIAVLCAAAYFVQRSWEKLQAGLAAMRLSLVLLSLGLTVAAKFVLGENARVAAARCGIVLSYPSMLRIYNLSQLGKYVPGSVWQFVGRAAVYRERGAPLAAIRNSLLIESLWVVTGAMIIGVSLVGSMAVSLLRHSASPAVLYWLAVLLVLGTVGTLAAWFWRRQALGRFLRLARPDVRVAAIQLAAWGLLGAAFWLLTLSTRIEVGLLYATGLFALAFALGFLVPIAPAGLGIRDGILTLGLLAHGSLQDAVVVTVVARLVYLIAELGLVAVQESAAAVLTTKRRPEPPGR